MTNFKQIPRNFTFQHLFVAEVATCPNKEVAERGGRRRAATVERSDSDSDDLKIDAPEERDISTGSGPTCPLVEDAEMIDVKNFSSIEGNSVNELRSRSEDNGGSRRSSGSDDSESGFSSSSSGDRVEVSSSREVAVEGSAGNEVEAVRKDPQSSQAPARAIIGVGYEETGLGHFDVPMKRPRNVEWVADEVLRVKSIYRSGIELPVLEKQINNGSRRILKVEGMKDREHVARWAGEF